MMEKEGPSFFFINKQAVYLKYKPALRLPDGLFAVPKPKEPAPDGLLPKAELPPNPSGTALDRTHVIKQFTYTIKSKIFHIN